MKARARVYDIAIFRVGDAAIAGGIEEGGFLRELAATFENQFLYKAAMRVGVELGPKHCG